MLTYFHMIGEKHVIVCIQTSLEHFWNQISTLAQFSFVMNFTCMYTVSMVWRLPFYICAILTWSGVWLFSAKPGSKVL